MTTPISSLRKLAKARKNINPAILLAAVYALLLATGLLLKTF